MDFLKNKVLTFEQAREYLGYSKSYMHKLTSSGILPFSKPNGKKIFLEKEKVEAWMLSNPHKSNIERQTDAANYETSKKKKKKE